MQQLVIETLKDIARLMELSGENAFKIRAYSNGARALGKLEEAEFKSLVAKGKLQTIPGIGAGLEEAILAILKTGSAQALEELAADLPLSLLELYGIPGLGTKRVLLLYQELAITNLGELEYACRENRLLQVPGFGEKRQEEILRGIETLRKYQDSFLYPEAKKEAQTLLNLLTELNPRGRQKITGSLRRKLAVAQQIEILIQGLSKEEVLANLPLENPRLEDNKIRAKTKNGFPVSFRFTKKENWARDLIYSTGSRRHLEHLAKEGDLPSLGSEKEIYEELGFNFIPPELREGVLEVGPNPDFSYLVTVDDIQGVFHNHTLYSDGVNTLEEIALHGKKLGYAYLGIADHSKSAYYANGLQSNELEEQIKEIDRINSTMQGITLLKGLEVDILADGSLDCEDSLLAKLDYVVASVHSGFKMNKQEMTKRVKKALTNRYVTMLGHPTGRLLLAREPYAIDLEEIIEVASSQRVILEINANPMRLDLDWQWAHKAHQKGVLLAINPDAHRLSGFDYTKYGIDVARKAGLSKEAILNTHPLGKVLKVFKQSRQLMG